MVALAILSVGMDESVNFELIGGIWWLVDLILIATKHPFQDIEWVED